jgi:hypothetical protein
MTRPGRSFRQGKVLTPEPTIPERHPIPIDILSDATGDVLKKYRLWFSEPAEIIAALRVIAGV